MLAAEGAYAVVTIGRMRLTFASAAAMPEAPLPKSRTSDRCNTSGRVSGLYSVRPQTRVLKSYFCTDDLKILVVTNGDVAKKALDGLGALEMKEIE